MAKDLFPLPRIQRTSDGENGFILSSETSLEDYHERVLEFLQYWAEQDPERLFISQRTLASGSVASGSVASGPVASGSVASGKQSGEWESITFGEMFSRVRCLGQALLERGCNAARPVAVLTGNSIASASVILATMYAGIPIVPISAAYSQIPEAFNRLEYCLGLVTPGAIFVEDGEVSGDVITRLPHYGVCIAARNATGSMVSLGALLHTDPGNIDEVFASTGLNTIVKLLFTSGSTGTPKAVVNTNRMLSSNQQQLAQIYPFLEDDAPVVLDWLPWSHTFGGNEVFLMALRHGGHLYLDAGKPVASQFETTLNNLRDVAPTIFFNVPLGYDLLATALEQDDELNKHFFSRLKMLFYSASALPQSIRDRLEALAQKAGRDSVAIVTAWGATETAPLATGVHYNSTRTDNIGVPVSGCEIRFAQVGGHHELRVRGPNVTPGYWRNAEKTAEAFDEQGFYKTGDAAYLMDEQNPSQGIIFDGRVSEDFKLLSGTWVPVGKLRVSLVNALLPLAQDVIVLGQDWESVCVLVFPNFEECQGMNLDTESGEGGLLTSEALLQAIKERLLAFNEQHTASSMRINRFGVLVSAPSMKDHEITEKGSINQKGVIANREQEVQQLRHGGTGIISLEQDSNNQVERTTHESQGGVTV